MSEVTLAARTQRWILVLAVTCSLVAASCAPLTSPAPQSAPPDATSAPAPSAGGNLNVRLTGDWDVLDPSGATVPNAAGLEMMLGTYDRLVQDQPRGDPVPYLATSWRFTDSASIVFDLRSDVTCQDGTPLTPTAVANSFTRLFQTPNAATVFGAGTPTITPNDAAHTIEFKWSHPNLDALFGFGTPTAGVICPAGLADPSKLTDTPAGSGPYVLSSAVHGASAVLRKNPAWSWGPGGATAQDLPDTLTFTVVANDTTAANELITGELDAATIQGPDVARLDANSALQHIVTKPAKLVPLTLNATTGHPTADPQVRRAIMTAVDPAAWNQATYDGRGQTGTSIFSTDARCYEPATAELMPKPSLDSARQILLADGYTLGSDNRFSKNGQPLSLDVLGSPAQWGKGTEYIGVQLTALGVNVTVDDLDRATYVMRLRAGNYDVSMFPQVSPDIPSGQLQYMAGPLPPTGVNFAYYVDPTADSDFEAALNADQAQQCQDWSKFQLDLLRNSDYLPLAAPPSDFFTQQNISSVTIQGLGFDAASLRRTH
jgi:peptide/nickel transport system substrate-binding protein